MLKLTTTQNKLPEYIEELTGIWLLWMKNHNISNNTALSFAARRNGGEECERLQKRRQELLVAINDLFTE